jgi:hypothetical protein
MLLFLDKYFPKAELVDFTVEKLVLFIRVSQTFL